MKNMKKIYKKSAQDIQDEIFRKMPAEKKIRLTGLVSALRLKLNHLNENRKSGTCDEKLRML